MSDRAKKASAKPRAKRKGATASVDDYEVGYKKPPKASRFQPGKSGNPLGRKKRAKSMHDDLQEELNSTVIINEGGKRQRVTKRRLMAKQLVNKSAAAEIPAVRELLQLLRNMPMVGVVETEEEKKQKEALIAELIEAIENGIRAHRELELYKLFLRELPAAFILEFDRGARSPQDTADLEKRAKHEGPVDLELFKRRRAGLPDEEEEDF